MSRLFGTDGVRGIAGTQLDWDLAVALGRAAVRCLGQQVLIGRDSRVSGPMLEDALVAGIRCEGGYPVVTGVIPTPAVAFLTRTTDADCGIVISASHNPPEYNGIKFFDSQGFKLPDEVEDEMQTVVEQLRGQEVPEPEKAAHMVDATQRYIAHAVQTVSPQGVDLAGIKVALDCGHGASCLTTPDALIQLGAEVVSINVDPDGSQINVDCGSTHLEPLIALMHTTDADIGLAHDGDADRLLAVTPDGTVADGDFIEAICAVDMKRRGVLSNNIVVSTVMANLGFQKAMHREGIEVLTTQVGDRYVLERMRSTGACIGGEQSGHIIFLEYNSTGDGLVTALQLLGVMARTGESLAELMQVMERFPQSLINVLVTDKSQYVDDKVIAAAEVGAEAELGEEGRLLVRPSGTEPLIRVMVEARTQRQADEVARSVADIIDERMGI